MNELENLHIYFTEYHFFFDAVSKQYPHEAEE